MKNFPDETTMPRSEDGSESIRGGSIGLNRILDTFVSSATVDKKPRFNAVLLNAFTIFYNVWGMETFPTMTNIEQAFVTDVNLFLEYYDTYLSHVQNHTLNQHKYAPVIVYFPNYDHLPKELQKEVTGKRSEIAGMYKIFLNRHMTETGLVKTLDHCMCYFVTVGPSSYPHRDVLRSFRDISNRRNSLYTTGDPVGIMTHVPLDLHLSYRLRNLWLIERYTGRIRPSSDFIYKLDKEGRVPFYSAVHAVVGDSDLIKPLVSHKIRREILAQAQDEKWVSKGEDDVMKRLSDITKISRVDLRRYDFT